MNIFIDKNGNLFDGDTCNVDGMVKCQLDADGKPYAYYLLDGTPDTDKINTTKFTSLKESKPIDITKAFNKATKSIVDVLPHEMTSWKDQEEEARAYKSDTTISTPVLSDLIKARGLGETVLDLANKIIANADAYRAAYYPLLGKYQALIKQVDSATTVEEVEAIVW